jgi:hypothetical protein
LTRHGRRSGGDFAIGRFIRARRVSTPRCHGQALWLRRRLCRVSRDGCDKGYIWWATGEISWSVKVEMAKTLIDVDEEYLAAAQEALYTETKKDTVNAPLRAVAALAARRRDL